MAQPIRVLHVIDKFSMDGVNPSSCSRLFAEWIPLHDKSRFQVDVAGLRAKDAAAKFLESHGIQVFYINKGKISPAIIGEIARIARDGNYDILHLHGYTSANFGRIAARKLGIRSVMHEHAILKIQPHQFIVDWMLKRKTDVAVAVSDAVKTFMGSGRSVPLEKVKVIWNGVALDSFKNVDPEAAKSFRQQFNIPFDATIVGTITRLREEKGNAPFLDAAKLVLEEFPDTHFVLVGDGPLKAELETRATQLGIRNRVVFTGFVANILPALESMDVVAVPSLREGFGLAMVEAMACRKPVVATRVGGMVEIAEDGKSALLVPPANGRALADAILRMLRDTAFREKIAEQGREVSQKFSIEKNVQALEQLYTELAHKGAA